MIKVIGGCTMIVKVTREMIHYEKGNKERIQHFLKVYGFAKTIASLEQVSEHTQFIIEIAALVHDIGIKESMIRFGSSSGVYQEQVGPMLARELLEGLQIQTDVIDRVCYLVGHHHTYTNIEGIDYQILVEADFLVNIAENSMNETQIATIKERIFKTKSGLMILEDMYECY